MNTTQCDICGAINADSAVYCASCGAKLNHAAKSASTYMQAPVKKLHRSATDSQIAGVCGGLAEYTDTDVSLVRLLTILAVFFTGGTALIAYFIAALIIPLEPVEMNYQQKKTY